MSPTHTRRRGRLYGYYVSQTVLKRGPETCPVPRVPAAEIEAIVIVQIRKMLTAPEIIAATWHRARSEMDGLTEANVREALLQFEPLWDELFPAEQARIVQLLVDRIDVGTDSIDIKLRVDGIASLVREVAARAQTERGRRHERSDDNRAGSSHADGARALHPEEARRAEARDHAGGRTLGASAASDRQHARESARASLRWKRMFETGKYASLADLAAAEKINASYLCRMLRLTLLSPAVVEAILDGHQPAGLEVDELPKVATCRWKSQAEQLYLGGLPGAA